MHEVLDNRLGGLSLPRKSVVRLTDRPDMTLDVYRGRKTTKQQKTKLFLLINVKMTTIVGILTFMSGKNSILDVFELTKSRISLYFYTYERLKFHA